MVCSSKTRRVVWIACLSFFGGWLYFPGYCRAGRVGKVWFTRMFGIMFCVGLAWAVIGDLIILPAILACYPHKRKQQPEPVADPVA